MKHIYLTAAQKRTLANHLITLYNTCASVKARYRLKTIFLRVTSSMVATERVAFIKLANVLGLEIKKKKKKFSCSKS